LVSPRLDASIFLTEQSLEKQHDSCPHPSRKIILLPANKHLKPAWTTKEGGKPSVLGGGFELNQICWKWCLQNFSSQPLAIGSITR
jgi:hypothetical protein